MKIEGVLTPPKGGKNKHWGVQLPLIGVHTQGRTKKEALDMAVDAVESLVNKEGFEATCDFTSGNDFLLGSNDTATFMGFVLSRIRTEKKLTARAAAEAMASKVPTAYTRYESGAKVPSIVTLEQLLAAIDPKITLVVKAS
jgi:predicted RNase H-like HicB family nuclease